MVLWKRWFNADQSSSESLSKLAQATKPHPAHFS